MEGLADRLRQARERHYKSARQAAAAMGVPYGTYSGHESGSRSPDLGTLDRYARFFRASVEWLAFGKAEAETMPDISAAGHNLATTHVDVVPVVGVVEAGAFRVVDDLSQIEPDDFEGLTVPRDARYFGMRCFAFEVRGDSMDRVIPNGSYVVAVDIVDYADRYGPVASGRYVVVERTNGHMKEWTVKEAVVFADRIELRPCSTNPRHKTITVPLADLDNGSEVRILGVVSGAHSRL